jgi:integrase
MEQVQLMLGHASPQTTSQYIGAALDLDDHAVDRTEVYIPEI